MGWKVHTIQATALLLALALATPLWSQGSQATQGFDAADFFGPDYTPDRERPDAGLLSNSLSEDSPEWLDFSCSDAGRALDRFDFTTGGLESRPGKQQTCEALLDIGVSDASAVIQLVELDRGGAFGWHLRDLQDPTSAWLVEIKHNRSGSYQLRIRVSNNGRYASIPSSKVEIETLTLPVEFKLTIKADKLKADIGTHTSEAKIEIKNGVSIGLATTDERSRIRDLSITSELHRDWVKDAASRLLARRTLQRLREYATTGLLRGIASYPHPELKEALKGYTEAEREARSKSTDENSSARAKALHAIAVAHPTSAFAQHEAGLASLLAGQISEGQRLLIEADKLTPTPVTSLALAEACRRVGETSAAQQALQRAQVDLPDALEPDRALLEGRLMADRGDIAAARRTLVAAAREFPENPQLIALADSAEALLNPPTLMASSLPGPLGLQLMSDIPEAQLKPVMNRLKPYLENIRLWLPDLEEELDGFIAIYASPIEYLRAALLVAGDNLDNIAGMYMPHGINNAPSVVACRAFGEDELLRTLVHELWHLSLASTGRGQTTPRWLDEGMAVFLSAGRFEKEAMSYGELPTEFGGADNPFGGISTARMELVLDARPQEFYLPGEVRGNYLVAWATVWFYASRGGGGQLLRDLLKGDEKAFKVINADHEQLRQEISRAVKDGVR